MTNQEARLRREDVYGAAQIMRRQLRLDRERSAYWRARQEERGELDTVSGWIESLIDWSATSVGSSTNEEFDQPIRRTDDYGHACAYCGTKVSAVVQDLSGSVTEPDGIYERTVPIDYDYTLTPCGHVFRKPVRSDAFTLLNRPESRR